MTDMEIVVEQDVLGNVLGLAFNPTDPADPVTLYVSHTQLYAGEDGPPYAGTITKLVVPSLQRTALITGLPVSTVEHGTNSIAFDDDGALYIAQGAMTNAGRPSERFPRPESSLSGAILVADLADPAFDGTILHQPPDEVGDAVDQVAGDVRVYASGFRNPFDLVLHSNGKIYATDNGPNLDDGAQSVSCDDFRAPDNAFGTFGLDPVAPDELNLIVEGEYYGHPNRNRGRLDGRQCIYRAPDDNSGESIPPLATLGVHTSADGIVEYDSGAFGGRLRGDLVYVEWARGRVWRVVLAEDGTSVQAISPLVPDTLRLPLDLVVGPGGTLFITEMGADRITYLMPSPGE